MLETKYTDDIKLYLSPSYITEVEFPTEIKIKNSDHFNIEMEKGRPNKLLINGKKNVLNILGDKFSVAIGNRRINFACKIIKQNMFYIMFLSGLKIKIIMKLNINGLKNKLKNQKRN
jgi:hypothetical protein